ncbi:MAG: type II toxin-antitoxin system VapC family toxin [Bacteroidota bacterium]
MGRQKYLIDTNVAIEYFGETLPEKALVKIDDIVDNQYFVSMINKIELLGFSGITENEEQNFLKFINAANLIVLDEAIVNKTIELRKLSRIKLPDAIIAATALVKDLTLITRNTKYFEKILGLKLVDPFNL